MMWDRPLAGFGNFPVCERHWRLLRPKEEPVRMVDAPERRCAFCGRPTSDGIGIRLDRQAVNHPETELR